tara:strand:+ start:290 stop:445 length:156 start_codon:yes stop_codon:yes gene_type:complete
MTITLSNCSSLEQKLKKVINQLPYKPTKEDFIKGAVEKTIEKMVKDKMIKL